MTELTTAAGRRLHAAMALRPKWEPFIAAIESEARQTAEARVGALEAALRGVGYEYGVCDACGGVPEDPREPGVICAWCAGAGSRVRAVAKPDPA